VTDRGALLRWYRRKRRDLPWRRTSDPYAIWVSEIMLQQTQVTTVLPYYDAFLARFPDVAALAAATEDEVLAQWTGLGYYRRARSLHRGAREVVARHDGVLPADAEGLRALPGIGRYTAGAIASIAFDKPEPILDGNVRRVLARRFAINEEKRHWELAEELVRGASPGDLNQGLMELGATICHPRAPECPSCPWRTSCLAFAQDAIERFPTATPRKASVTVRVGVAVIRRGNHLLFERPDDENPLRGTWDFPAVELGASSVASDELVRSMRRRHGIDVSVGACLGSATHGILHRRLKLEAHAGSLRRGRVAGSDRLQWVPLDAVGERPVSGATRKILRLLA
jgi:A/G-specific adenine glycosylase